MGLAVLRDISKEGMARERGVQSPLGADAQTVSSRAAEEQEATKGPVRGHVAPNACRAPVDRLPSSSLPLCAPPRTPYAAPWVAPRAVCCLPPIAFGALAGGGGERAPAAARRFRRRCFC